MDPLLLCFPGKLRCSFLLRAKAYNWSLFAIFSGNLGSGVAYVSNKQGRAPMDTYSAHSSNWLWLLLSCTRSQMFPGSTQSQHVERKGTTLPLLETSHLYMGHDGERENVEWSVCVCLLEWPTVYIHVSWANNTILSLFFLGLCFEVWPWTHAHENLILWNTEVWTWSLFPGFIWNTRGIR